MEGEFIKERKLESILKKLTVLHGISLETYSSNWVYVFRKDQCISRLIGYTWSLNDAAASATARDKVATYEILRKTSIPAIEHILVRSAVDKSPNLPTSLSGAFVLKPLHGTSGHGITLHQDHLEAIDYLGKSHISEWAVAPFVKIEREIRIILLDNICLLSYEKVHPAIIQELPFFNLGRGARVQELQLEEDQLSLAQRAQRAVGLRLAAVDLVYSSGKWHVLEINDGIMMEHYLRASETNYSEAEKLYERILLVSLT